MTDTPDTSRERVERVRSQLRAMCIDSSRRAMSVNERTVITRETMKSCGQCISCDAAALLRALLARAEAAERQLAKSDVRDIRSYVDMHGPEVGPVLWLRDANREEEETDFAALRARLAALAEHKNELVLAVHDRHHHTKPQNRKDVVALAVEMVLSELRAILKGDDDG